jgi:hypothetical protein
MSGANVNLTPAIEMFPDYERERVRVQEVRYLIAMEDVDAISEDYFQQYVSRDRLARWGPPDTARNALAAIGHAVSTPGHYGRAPTLVGLSAAPLAELCDDLWPKQQHAEYLTYTCGSCAVLVEPGSGEGEEADDLVSFSVVPSHRLWATAHQDDPTEPVVMRRLRIRRINQEAVYTWDVWDVSDPAFPSWGVYLAEGSGKLGRDVTFEATGSDALEGDAYPWRRLNGSPFLPWSIHRSWDVGDLWNWQRGRSVARGTLQAMMLFSACNRAALNATGKVALVFNAKPIGSTVRGTDDGMQTMSLDAEPGDLVYHVPLESGVQPSVTEIGEVDTLPALQAYAMAYSSQLAADMGITPTDAVRAGANPMSGVAIHLTNETKREEQRRRGPLCRKADLRTVRHAAYLAGLDPAGVGIVYHEVGKSPDEERAEREDQEWSLKNGFASSSDVMMARNPGMSREEALLELARIQREAGLAAPSVEAAVLRLDAILEQAGPLRSELAEVQALLEGVPSEAYHMEDDSEEGPEHEGMESAAVELAEGEEPEEAAAMEGQAAPPPVEDVAASAAVEVALNGAQAEFLVATVSAVAKGELPKSAGFAAVRIALPMVPEDQIAALFADVVEGSTAPPETGGV